MVNPQATMTGIGAIAIGVLVLVVAFTIIPVVGDQIDQAITIQGDETATGTLTFSGNASCGEFINITTAAGTKITFEMNITSGSQAGCVAKREWADDVVMAYNYNTSTVAATNLTAAINANATISAVMTATNPSAGVVVLTHTVTGTTGNSVATTETATAASWAVATLTGGVDGSDWNSEHNTNIPTGVDLWESIGGILKVAAIILIVGGFLKTLQGIRATN